MDNVNTSFSLLYLFTDSDLLTRVMSIALFFASIWSWAIIVEKFMTINRIREATKIFEEKFWSGGSLDDLYSEFKDAEKNPMADVFVAAMKEWKKSSKIIPLSSADKKFSDAKIANLQQRMERIMHVSLERNIDALEHNVGFLGTLGSIAPFLGLFGTVWGVMSSFSAIGTSNNASLVVVAPGIAVALATTALGLIVAIPAVVAYNRITLQINSYALKVENFAGEFSTIISRQVDETTK
jgi:biopolymer transport protein TolQ